MNHSRLPRGKAFHFTPFINDECIVTERVMPGLPRMGMNKTFISSSELKDLYFINGEQPIGIKIL